MAFNVGRLVATLEVDDDRFRGSITKDKAELATLAKTVNVPIKVDDKGTLGRAKAEAAGLGAEMRTAGRWITNAEHEATKLKTETQLTRTQVALLGVNYQSVGDKVDAAFGKERKLTAEAELTSRQVRMLGLGYQSVGDKVDAAFNRAKTGAETAESRTKTSRLQAMLLGVEYEKAADKVSHIDREIAKATASMSALRREFDKTGDSGLLKQHSAVASVLGGLQKLRKDAEEAGDVGGKGFLAGMVSSIASGAGAIASFGLIPSLLVALLALSPLIVAVVGGAVSAGVLLGAGGGALIAGLAIAAKNPAVGAAFAPLGRTIGNSVASAVRVYLVPPLVGTASIFAAAWNKVSPQISGIFKDVSVQVRPLAAGLAGMVTNMMPGIRKAVDAAGPLISVLAAHLPDIGNAISDFLDSIAHAGPGATRFFHDLLTAIQAIIVGVGQAIEVFAFMYAAFAAFADRVRELFGGGHEDTTGKLKGVAAAAKEAAGGIGAAGDAAASANPEMRNVAVATTVMNGSFNAGITAAGGLAGALQALNGPALDARSAARNYEASLDNATEALKRNGKTLDDNTDAGRANNQALDDVAGSVQNLADKRYKETLTTSGERVAHEAMARTLEDGKAKLIATYLQFDHNIGRARAYADAVLKIPPSMETTISTPGLITANGSIDYFTRQVRGLDGKVITVTTKFITQGDVTHLGGQVSANSAGKQVYVNHSSVGFRAAGGPVARGKSYIVGEHRPELFVPKVDGMIVPQVPTSTRPRAYGASSGTASNEPTVIRVIIDGTGILRGIRSEVRAKGGNVQTVLSGA